MGAHQEARLLGYPAVGMGVLHTGTIPGHESIGAHAPSHPLDRGLEWTQAVVVKCRGSSTTWAAALRGQTLGARERVVGASLGWVVVPIGFHFVEGLRDRPKVEAADVEVLQPVEVGIEVQGDAVVVDGVLSLRVVLAPGTPPCTRLLPLLALGREGRLSGEEKGGGKHVGQGDDDEKLVGLKA